MASLWRVGDVDVYVLNHDSSSNVKQAEIVVLDANATSVLHFFGSGAKSIEVGGWVFSEANKTTLEGYANANTTVILTSNRGNEGNFKVQDFKTKEFGPFVSLQLPGYDPDDTSIYKFSAKLIKI
jgi:hypothetical protein